MGTTTIPIELDQAERHTLIHLLDHFIRQRAWETIRSAHRIERFDGLSVDEGRTLYATLSREEQKALDDRGLKSSWRSIRASEAHQRRQQDAWQRAIDDAKAKKAPGGGA